MARSTPNPDADVIRVLMIGRAAVAWSQKLADRAPGVEFDLAKLPAAGVRQLEHTPPDAVVVFEDGGTDRLIALVDAIKKRPLGALTPVIVVSHDALADTQRKQMDVAAWVDIHGSDEALLTTLAERLGLDLTELTTDEISRQATTMAPPIRVETPDFVIEEIDDDRGPRQLKSSDIFPERFNAGNVDDLDESELRRKLRSVRHEDYFTILEIPRGAEPPSVREAFQRMNARFDANRISFDLQHRYHAELAEIRDAFEDAWAVLGDAKLRKAYLDHTTRR